MTTTTPHPTARPPSPHAAPRTCWPWCLSSSASCPSDSVVMLTFGAAQAFHARVDLPDDPARRGGDVELLLGAGPAHRCAASSSSSTATATTSPTRPPTHCTTSSPRRHRDRGDAPGRRVAVVPAASRSRRCTLVGGCSYDISAHPFLAHAVLRGQVTHDSRDELAASVEVDPERAARIGELVAALPEPLALGRRAAGGGAARRGRVGARARARPRRRQAHARPTRRRRGSCSRSRSGGSETRRGAR